MSSDKFVLTVLDVPDSGRGVGLAIVLQTPGGKTYLYDTGNGYPGPNGWVNDQNTGRDLIAPFLRERSIDALDGVIISHAHYDHFGGLLWLVDQIPIAKLIDSGYEFRGEADAHYSRELADYVALRERFKQRTGAYQAACAGDTLDLDPDLNTEVVAPPKGFFHEDSPQDRPANNPAAHYMLNSNSLMLRIQHGGVTFFLPGDIEKDDQVRYLLPGVPRERLACDVLVAPGHGLHSSEEFADATRPRITIASCHARWASSCTARQAFAPYGGVYVTGLQGDVSVASDGECWEVNLGPWGSPRAETGLTEQR